MEKDDSDRHYVSEAIFVSIAYCKLYVKKPKELNTWHISSAGYIWFMHNSYADFQGRVLLLLMSYERKVLCYEQCYNEVFMPIK